MANLTVLGGSVASHGATSDVDSTQQTVFGSLGIDSDKNLYMYVDFQESFIAGEVVVVNHSYAATQITSTSIGWVGIVVGTVSASDRFGWVQIYGVHTAALGTSGITSGSPLVISATSSVGHFDAMTSGVHLIVHGAWARTAGETATSPVASSDDVGLITVQLNFPYVNGQLEAGSS